MKHPLNPTSRNEGLAHAVVERIDTDKRTFDDWWRTKAGDARRLMEHDTGYALRMVAWEAFRRGSQHAAEERDKLHQHLHGYQEKGCKRATHDGGSRE